MCAAFWGSGVSSFQWTDFLQLAEVLAQQAQAEASECKRRTAISRAYYATYHAARGFAVRTQGFKVERGGSSHSKLWSDLSFAPGKVAKLGNQGKQLFALRLKADYEPSPRIEDAQVRMGLTFAKNAAQLLGEVDPPPSPPAAPPVDAGP